GQAAFVRNGADNLAWFHLVSFTDFNAIRDHGARCSATPRPTAGIAALATPTLGGSAVSTLELFAQEALVLCRKQQGLFALCNERQGCRHVNFWNVVVLNVMRDDVAEPVYISRPAECRGDGVI